MPITVNYFQINLCRFLFAACYLLLSQLVVAETCEGDNIVLPDSSLLMKTVEPSATTGDAHAQVLMGVAYLRGKGVELDKSKGLSWLEKSSTAGSSEGQYLLGQYYFQDGKANDEDLRKAVEYFHKSAAQDCPAGLLSFGMFTATGKGVSKNTTEGLQMITKAADAGYLEAQWWLGTLMLTGELGAVKDPKAGFNWIKQAADAGYSAAGISLANLYFSGIGTQLNREAALTLLKSVYNKHDEQAPMAAYFLGWIYMEGKGVPVDLYEAFHWMVIAASFNASDSLQRLKTLTEKLPKQQLATECSVYMDPLFASNGAKEFRHVSASEKIILLNTQPTFYEVYFVNKSLLGFIPQQCLKKLNAN